MANLGFALRSSFGFIPNTEKIEATQQKLEDDYNRFKAIENSDELKEYQALETYIQSSEFIDKKTEIKGLNYKNTDEFTKEKTFTSLVKNKKIKHYLKTLNADAYTAFLRTKDSAELAEHYSLEEATNSESHKIEKSTLAENLKIEKDKALELKKLKKDKSLKRYYKITNSSAYKVYLEYKDSYEDEVSDEQKKEANYKGVQKFIQSGKLSQIDSVENSGILEQFKSLDEYVNSSDYTQAIESLKYENSQGFQTEQKFNQLKSSEQIKQYLKYEKSKAFKLFTEVEESDHLKEYYTLKELTESEEFIKHKEYMLDKDKFSKTEEAAKEKKHISLGDKEDIKWYKAIKDNNAFNSLFDWKLTFDEPFNTNKIDEEKWMNSFFWGKMLINDRYVLAGDKQYFTDNKNTVYDGSTLQIVTKQENAKGKVWHPIHGFSEQEFSYTSGMLSTAHHFRQKYGKFEAKVKLDPSYPVYQAFWLKGEKIVPEIDIFKFNMSKKNRMQLASHNANGDSKPHSSIEKLNGSPFTKKFHIFTLEWTPEKICWLINGIEVYSLTENIPDEAMYLMLSSGVQKDPKNEPLNAAFEIDWVRCYERAE